MIILIFQCCSHFLFVGLFSIAPIKVFCQSAVSSDSESETKRATCWDTHYTKREEDQRDYTLEMVLRLKAVMRANPERDLLCVPWRGRAVANSPMLRLDESTVNASSQKSKRGGKKWAMRNIRQSGETKDVK